MILQDVKVPAENLLGEIGKGHKVAFNVLNFGRFKLGAMCSGGAQGAIGEAAKYAADAASSSASRSRRFGAIKHKLGEMIVAHLRGREPALSHRRPDRRAHRRDAARRRPTARPRSPRSRSSPSKRRSRRSPAARCSTSCSTRTSRSTAATASCSDYPAERHYRDARVNRIFEGTNEINRLLIPGMLARRAVKGDAAAHRRGQGAAGRAARAAGDAGASDDAPLADERRAVAAFKKMALMVLGMAMQTYGEKLADEQEVLMHVADILIDVFSAESAVLRALAAVRPAAAARRCTSTPRACSSTTRRMRIDASARQALAAMAEGDTLRTMLAALRRLLKVIADQHA